MPARASVDCGCVGWFDSSECLVSENGWCRRVGGVHHVELTPYVQQLKRRKRSQWEMPFFAVCQLGNPLMDFWKKLHNWLGHRPLPMCKWVSQLKGGVSAHAWSCRRQASIFDYFLSLIIFATGQPVGPSNAINGSNDASWEWGPRKNFNSENLKFTLKFSVLAPITSGLEGVSSQNFFPDDVPRVRGDKICISFGRPAP